MKKFPNFLVFLIPIIILAVLVCISLGSFASVESTSASLLDNPSNGIFGFGFWEGRLHLVAMLFPLLLMFIASVERSEAKAN